MVAVALGAIKHNCKSYTCCDVTVTSLRIKSRILDTIFGRMEGLFASTLLIDSLKASKCLLLAKRSIDMCEGVESDVTSFVAFRFVGK